MNRHHRLVHFAVLAIAAGLVLASCDFTELGDGERGSGNLITETRQVSPFSAVDASSAVTVSIVVDENAEPAVSVTYDDNMLDNLVTRVENDTLIITLEGNINLTGNANRVVEVTMRDLDSLTASGASTVTAVGAAPRLELDVSGASTINLERLTVGDLDVDASGASDVLVFVTGSATGAASGASSVELRGNPTDVRIETSGASSLDLP